MPPKPTLTEDFFARVKEPQVFTDLFEVLPEVYLFVKDREHRFVKVNRSLARMRGGWHAGPHRL